MTTFSSQFNGGMTRANNLCHPFPQIPIPSPRKTTQCYKFRCMQIRSPFLGYKVIIIVSEVYRMPKKHTTSNKTKKRKGKDMDQIIEEMKSEKQRCFTAQHIEFNFDLSGNSLSKFIYILCFFVFLFINMQEVEIKLN